MGSLCVVFYLYHAPPKKSLTTLAFAKKFVRINLTKYPKPGSDGRLDTENFFCDKSSMVFKCRSGKIPLSSVKFMFSLGKTNMISHYKSDTRNKSKLLQKRKQLETVRDILL